MPKSPSSAIDAALGHFVMLASERTNSQQDRGNTWFDRTAADHFVAAAHNLDAAGRLLDQGLADRERRQRCITQAIDAAVYLAFSLYILDLDTTSLKGRG